MTTMTAECLAAALAYAKRGWAVFPLDGKRPYAGSHGHRDATTDPKQIRRWWREYPEANVGIACSSLNGPIVVDIDGPSGQALAEALDLPETREVRSRAGRRHLYYAPMLNGARVKRTIKVKNSDGEKVALDVLGDGGYVVAPPSIHPETGKRYAWLSRIALAPLPSSIFAVVEATRAERHSDGKGSAPPLPPSLGEGERDDLLTSLAGSMRRRGASEDAILAALREENATRCDPPLKDSQLRKIARSIGSKAPAAKTENATDLGNARRFIAQHGDGVRAVASQRNPWLIWEGTNWGADETGEVARMAKTTVRSIWSEAATLGDEEEREKLLKHASKSEQANKIRAMIELAATEPEIALTSDRLDADPWLFNVENGTLDLRSGALRPHRREDLITRLAPVEYSPRAKAQRWRRFMLEVMDDDAELVDFLQRAVGYAMTGDTREQCLFFCYGQGANGKSTFLETLRGLFGPYALTADFSSFMGRSGDGPRTDLARMRGARFVAASEADSERGFDGRVVKALTGSDTIVARKLYEAEVEYRPTHKLFLAANHRPIVKEQTDAFWRRMRLVPFRRRFERGREKDLEATLRAELPGILVWALEGCLRWQAEGLNEPRAVKRSTHDYKEENDLLGEFITARAALDTSAWTSTVDLYRVFGDWWVETRGPRSAVISLGWFTRMLGERADLSAKKSNGLRGWRGITLQQELVR